ncbi:FAD-binding protein [Nonomuraea sp. NPDC003754]
MSRARDAQVTVQDETDVVVIGGGAAGLAGAVALSRLRRRVVVVDAGRPRNAPAAGVHNYLSRDGIRPAELLAAGRRELAGYGGQVLEATVVAARRPDAGEGFAVELADGRVLRARRLLVGVPVVLTKLSSNMPLTCGDEGSISGSEIVSATFYSGLPGRERGMVRCRRRCSPRSS